jgi:cytoskeletal protein CcmA (bactofilin family)
VIVSGDVNGNISANGGLEITKTGKVFGDIVSDKLIVDEGAIYKGKVTLESSSKKE